MKLSSRKQLLSEADAELRRMQKLAGILKEDTSINEYGDGTKIPYVSGKTTIINFEDDSGDMGYNAEDAQEYLKKKGIKAEILDADELDTANYEFSLRIASKDQARAEQALKQELSRFFPFELMPEDEWNEPVGGVYDRSKARQQQYNQSKKK